MNSEEYRNLVPGDIVQKEHKLYKVVDARHDGRWQLAPCTPDGNVPKGVACHFTESSEMKNDYEILKKRRVTALDVQVGGSHYKDMKIQPGDYAFQNNLNVWQFNVVKYVSRYKSKAGLQDLKKAKHCIDLLIDAEYGEQN